MQTRKVWRPDSGRHTKPLSSEGLVLADRFWKPAPPENKNWHPGPISTYPILTCIRQRTYTISNGLPNFSRELAIRVRRIILWQCCERGRHFIISSHSAKTSPYSRRRSQCLSQVLPSGNVWPQNSECTNTAAYFHIVYNEIQLVWFHTDSISNGPWSLRASRCD